MRGSIRSATIIAVILLAVPTASYSAQANWWWYTDPLYDPQMLLPPSVGGGTEEEPPQGSPQDSPHRSSSAPKEMEPTLGGSKGDTIDVRVSPEALNFSISVMNLSAFTPFNLTFQAPGTPEFLRQVVKSSMSFGDEEVGRGTVQGSVFFPNLTLNPGVWRVESRFEKVLTIRVSLETQPGLGQTWDPLIAWNSTWASYSYSGSCPYTRTYFTNRDTKSPTREIDEPLTIHKYSFARSLDVNIDTYNNGCNAKPHHAWYDDVATLGASVWALYNMNDRGWWQFGIEGAGRTMPAYDPRVEGRYVRVHAPFVLMMTGDRNVIFPDGDFIKADYEHKATNAAVRDVGYIFQAASYLVKKPELQMILEGAGTFSELWTFSQVSKRGYVEQGYPTAYTLWHLSNRYSTPTAYGSEFELQRPGTPNSGASPIITVCASFAAIEYVHYGTSQSGGQRWQRLGDSATAYTSPPNCLWLKDIPAKFV